MVRPWCPAPDPRVGAVVTPYISIMTQCHQSWVNESNYRVAEQNANSQKSDKLELFERGAHGPELGDGLGQLGLGSEPATMPQPATRRALVPLSWAQRSAMPHSPLPSASTQPTGPVTVPGPSTPTRGSARLRRRLGSRRRRRSGGPRPPGPAPTGRRRSACPESGYRDAAGWAVGSARDAGRRTRLAERGERVSSDAAAYWCSSFSLAEPSSAAARPESSAGVAPRGVVPARTSELPASHPG